MWWLRCDDSETKSDESEAMTPMLKLMIPKQKSYDSEANADDSEATTDDFMILWWVHDEFKWCWDVLGMCLGCFWVIKNNKIINTLKHI